MIRKVQTDEYGLFTDFLDEDIFIKEAHVPPDRAIVYEPEL